MTASVAPHQVLGAALQSQDRIVISGASGWMGRSLLQELFLADSSLFPERVLALGSTTRRIQLLDGLAVNIVKASLGK